MNLESKNTFHQQDSMQVLLPQDGLLVVNAIDGGVQNVGEGHIIGALHPCAIKGHVDAVFASQWLRAVGCDAGQVVLTQAVKTN